MVHAKNYETMSTFVKVMQKKLWPLFFPDTVYKQLTQVNQNDDANACNAVRESDETIISVLGV